MGKKAAGKKAAGESIDKSNPGAGQTEVMDALAFEKPYATIMIPKGSDKKDAKTVTVRVTGTTPDGHPYEKSRVFRRGLKEYNVPRPLVANLENATVTEYETREKEAGADQSGANMLTGDTRRRFEFMTIATYDEKMTEDEIQADIEKSGK